MRSNFVLSSLLVTVLIVGCGGDADTTEGPIETGDQAAAESDLVPVLALTPSGVERCLTQGEATVISSEELNPGSPINAHGVFAIGSESGARIGIVLTIKPFITKRLSRELAEEGEYDISVTPSEEAVVVLDSKATAEDEALASRCSEPQ